jgi:LCP family protein required for cell wall assembly
VTAGHRSTAGRLRLLRPVGRALGALLSASLLLLAGYEWHTFRSINDKVQRLPIPSIVHPHVKNAVHDGQDMNILLVGNDDRSNMTDAEVRELKVGRDGGSLNTDTMMIVHVPADGSKATLISLPRDSYVAIPGHGMNKLNAAYSLGYNGTPGSAIAKRTAGADLLTRTVSNLTGLTINHYIQVSLMGFYDLAQAIGGIPVDLCGPVDDTHAHNVAAGGYGGSGFKMSAGQHTLTALQALEFVRQRFNFPNGLGDLDRVKRQQYFLTAAFRRVATVGFLFKLARLGDALERNVFMDQGLDLIELAHQMQKLSANNINGMTIPFVRFAYVYINGVRQSVEIVSPAMVRHKMRQLIDGPKHPGQHAHHRPSNKALDSKCIY